MVSVPTIYNWYKLWREQGLEGLANKQKTGRKPKVTDEYCLKLETLLAKDPSECGYHFAIWTSDRFVKDLACANKLHNSIEEVIASAEYMLARQNDPASSFRLTFSKLL